MSVKTLLTAAALAVLPTLGFAMGCSEAHERQAMSCADGTQWDDETGTCAPISTS